ncbi:hypothetical protein PoB_004083800 [Plakobranchus ocellatus]|uniref:Uncharacterized protein n=1 Tax=Plakobranchus ocellatus TaxID=259542 RepID=A0AAV4B431_9GAST|nr:hypothetical protein PoB_004083800 [Plakobranchus ocellatus]
MAGGDMSLRMISASGMWGHKKCPSTARKSQSSLRVFDSHKSVSKGTFILGQHLAKEDKVRTRPLQHWRCEFQPLPPLGILVFSFCPYITITHHHPRHLCVGHHFCQWRICSAFRGWGEKTAQRIVKLRPDNPFTLQSLCDLVRKDPEDLKELVSFDVSPPSHSGARRDLSD